MSIWFTFLYQPLLNLLMFLYQALGNNLGLAIIGATTVIRAALMGLTMPGMKSAQKMQEIKPHLDALKEKHKNDRQALAQAQMELYREHGINPFASMLPMIVQIIVIIALYQAFGNILKLNGDQIAGLNQELYSFVRLPEGTSLNTSFLYLNLMQPDLIKLPFAINLGLFTLNAIPGIFLFGAAVAQYVSTKMMMPKTSSTQTVKPVAKTGDGPDGEDMALMMQKQMLFLTPLMTLVIGYRFPSGLVLAWFMFSILMALQQLYVRKIVYKNSTPKNGQSQSTTR